MLGADAWVQVRKDMRGGEEVFTDMVCVCKFYTLPASLKGGEILGVAIVMTVLFICPHFLRLLPAEAYARGWARPSQRRLWCVLPLPELRSFNYVHHPRGGGVVFVLLFCEAFYVGTVYAQDVEAGGQVAYI